MGDSLTAVNCGNAQRATRNKRRKSFCRPIACSDCRSFPSDGSPSPLVYRPDPCRHRANLPDNRLSLGDKSARLSDNSSCLCRRSTDPLNDGTGPLDDSNAVLNHSLRSFNYCNHLKKSRLRFFAAKEHKTHKASLILCVPCVLSRQSISPTQN